MFLVSVFPALLPKGISNETKCTLFLYQSSGTARTWDICGNYSPVGGQSWEKQNTKGQRGCLSHQEERKAGQGPGSTAGKREGPQREDLNVGGGPGTVVLENSLKYPDDLKKTQKTAS